MRGLASEAGKAKRASRRMKRLAITVDVPADQYDELVDNVGYAIVSHEGLTLTNSLGRAVDVDAVDFNEFDLGRTP